MAASPYVRDLRRRIGNDLLLLPSVTVLTFDDHSRVLLAKHREGGVWIAPGGSVEPFERPADAAVREMWEETGLLVELTRILGVYGGREFGLTYANGDQVAYVVAAFVARPVGGELRPGGDEILELRYVSEEEVPDLPAPDWLRIVLADGFSAHDDPGFLASRWLPER